VKTELLPLTDRQRAVDNLLSAEKQDRGLTEIGDQKDHRKQKRKGPPDLELLLEEAVCGCGEAVLFVGLAAERADHLQPGDILLDDRVQRTHAHLHFHEQRLSYRPEEEEHGEGN